MQTIAVHNGRFHADEVFSSAIFRLIFPSVTIIRTRDEEMLKKADARVDVGMHYNAETHDYDHHQKEGAGERENGIPYASVGLVWKHFGKQLCSESAWQYIDERLVQPIDAADNGVTICTDCTIKPYTVSAVIEDFNADWKESDVNNDDRFEQMVELAMTILSRQISLAQSLEEANVIVRKAILEQQDGYLILTQFAPWKRVVHHESDVLYIVYESNNGSWNVQGVPKESPGDFAVRKPLPQAWGGLSNEALQEVTKVDDALFCHRALFLAAAKTKEGALQLVKLALAN